MSNPNSPENQPGNDSSESFGELLSQYERSHKRKPEEAGKPLEGTVIALTADSVLFDIGYKTEGILPLTALLAAKLTVQPGHKLPVSVKGRDPEGYYELALGKVKRPTDWASLEKAFADKEAIAGTVTGVVKGGLSVDVGIRAFMPASRSGTRDAGDMEKLVGQEIRCRIIKLDVADEDVVVDRRAIAEEEERAVRERRFSEIKEGDTVSGTVRSITDYGAFVDIGGVDALLHVGDIGWGRVSKPSDVLTAGQQVEGKIVKIDTERRRISFSMKELQAQPWDLASEKYKVGERVRGTATRLTDFGAFVELEPGIEGLIHISEMSWTRRIRKPSDAVKPGETVEAVILSVNPVERRISLGLKQALGDPWVDVPHRFPVGSVIEGQVISIQKFGAFLQIAEGVEGMIHVGDLSAEKRINHPQEVLKVGQSVKAQVLEVDTEKRRLRLGIKQMVPSSLDEYIAEHKAGDVVSGRMVEIAGGRARVELGEGVQGSCKMGAKATAASASESSADKGAEKSRADLSSLSSMLSARWKGANAGKAARQEDPRIGQIRSFRIASLDPTAKKIELELAE